MALIISALLFMLLMLSISLYGYRRYARPGRFYEQLGTELISVSHPDIDPVTGLVVRVIKTIGEKVPISPESASSTRLAPCISGIQRIRSTTPTHNACRINPCADRPFAHRACLHFNLALALSHLPAFEFHRLA